MENLDIRSVVQGSASIREFSFKTSNETSPHSPGAVIEDRFISWKNSAEDLGVLDRISRSMCAPDIENWNSAIENEHIVAAMKDSPELEQFVEFIKSICADVNHETSYRGMAAIEGVPPLPNPIRRVASERLHSVIVERRSSIASDHIDLESLIQSELECLEEQLHELLLPILVTELHVYAERQRFQYESDENLFLKFSTSEIHSQVWMQEALTSYPVAWRNASRTIEQSRQSFFELIERFNCDRQTLIANGMIGAGRLIRLSKHGGDRHREGRSVRVLYTDCGARCVYKPRVVDIDKAVGALLAWSNSICPIDLQSADVIAGDGYGWFGYVSHLDCLDEAGVERFYQRQGANIALLYLLGGRDFFAENVRACGDIPFLLDLECMISPQLPPAANSIFLSAAGSYLAESVESSGLLPHWSWSHLGPDGVNLSGMWDAEGQSSAQEVVALTDFGSSRLRQVKSRRKLFVTKMHLPSLGTVSYSVQRFAEEVIAGFLAMYESLETHRQFLSDDSNSPLNAFKKSQSRVLLRNTLEYDTLIRASHHPWQAISGFKCDTLFDSLYLAEPPRFTDSIIEDECRQIRRGDIPIFTSTANSRDLYDDAGKVVESDYFARTGFEGITDRLARLGEDDRYRQVQILRRSFALADDADAASEVFVRPRQLLNGRLGSASRNEFMGEAEAIGDYLLDHSFEDADSISWIGCGLDQKSRWQQMSLDSGLYDGAHGIGMFFLQLHESIPSERYENAIKKILNFSVVVAAKRLSKRSRWLDGTHRTAPGAFQFPFSALYLATHAFEKGYNVDVKPLLDATIWATKGALECAPQPDFILGSAGIMRVLLRAYETFKDQRLIDSAMQHGDRLVETAVRLNDGISWVGMFGSPMGGFSHGNSGIALALAQLAQSTDNKKLYSAAQDALRFDRSLFSADKLEWRDLRDERLPGTAAQWCHGVGGIGLSRILLSKIFNDESLVNDALRAADLAVAYKESSDCLCHGTLGNADFCQTLAELCTDDLARNLRDAQVSKLWNGARERGGWRTAVPRHGVDLYGLFVGCAGVGYGLLRLARPGAIPSVLWLQ